MASAIRAPKRHLTHDDLELFTVRDIEVPVRIRIWQGVNATPIVLATQLQAVDPEVPSLGNTSTKIANYINEAILRHPVCGMLYFQDEFAFLGGRELFQFFFNFFGHIQRLRFFNPSVRCVDWREFESHVHAGPIKRLNP